MKQILRLLIPSFLILGLLCMAPTKSDAHTAQEELAREVLRFHILANSDSKEDQANKLLVRDAIMQEVSAYIKDCNSKAEVMEVLQPHLHDLAATAEKVLIQLGNPAQVSVSLENIFFPTKDYAGLTFPCGYYDALRVEIGAAQGHNWWCVMFPKLCFADLYFGYVPEASVDQLESCLTPTTYETLITGKSTEAKPNIIFRFRLFSWWN